MLDCILEVSKFELLSCYNIHFYTNNLTKSMNGGTHDVMDAIIGNGHSNPSSNLDKTVCISCNANTFGKGKNPTILHSVMGK